jgi:putative ABC transport system permease protein
MRALVMRGIAQRRLRSLLTGLAVLLGVAMIAGTYIQTDQIARAFTEITKATNAGSDVVITPPEAFRSDVNTGEQTLPESLVERVRTAAGVADAAPGLWTPGSIVLRGKRVGSEYAPGMLTAATRPPFDPTRVITGRFPAERGQIAVNRQLAEREHLRVGMKVGVATRTGVRNATLVGTIDLATGTSMGGATIILAQLRDIQEWSENVGRVSLVMAAGEPSVSPQQLAARIRSVAGARVTVRTGEAQAAHEADSINDQLGAFLRPMLLALAGASLMVGAFIIFNTFSVTVAQRSREFALLRSLGASRLQIVGAVTGEAALLGVVASLLGIGVGALFALALGALFDAIGFGIPRTGIVVEPRTVAISLGVGIGVTVIAALAPALRATRVPPIVALSGPIAPSARAKRWTPWVAGVLTAAGVALLVGGLFAGGPASARLGAMGAGVWVLFVGLALSARFFVRPVASVLGWPIERMFAVPGRLARENAMRSPGRTASTAAALMVGLGLVVFVAVFAAGLKASVNSSIDELVRADYIISAAGAEPLPAGAGDSISAAPGVRTSVAVHFDRIEVDGRKVNVTTDTLEGIDPTRITGVYRFRWLDGADDSVLDRLGRGTVLAEEQFAETHGKRVGDRLTVRTPADRTATLRIIGLYRDPQILQGAIVDERQFAEVSNARDPFLFMVSRRDETTAAATHRSLEQALTRFPAATVRSNAEYRDYIEAQLGQMTNLLYALLAMSLVISLFGIANNLFLSIHERTREFGLLRAVGATGSQIRRVVRYESVITSAIGGVLGVAVGVFFAWLVAQALADLGFGFALPVGQLVAFLGLAVIVGILGATVPARRGARIDVLRALHHE